MNAPRYAVAAAKLLAKHLPTARPGLRERERSVATIERALQARARRRALYVGVGSLSAVAAAALLVFVSWRKSGTVEQSAVSINVASATEGAALRSGETTRPVSSGVELLAGQRLETSRDGGATLRLSTGTSVVLAHDTSFRVKSQGKTESFALDRGELLADVSKLGDGQRFLIQTPDAEVEVRGTRFRLRIVERAEDCGDSRTRLEVSEGVVEVRSSKGTARVTQGQAWPRECPQQTREVASVPATSVGDPAPAQAGTAVRAPAPGISRPIPHVASAQSPSGRDSALTRQNDLFAAAVALRRQGDSRGALRTYEQLIRRFPNSPLSENAMVERMRLLASQGIGVDASSEAKRYLARYPRGFAVEEAHRLVGNP